MLILLTSACAESRVLMRGTLERESSPWKLRFESNGRAYIENQRVYLRKEVENRHFGVSVVDTASLPREWTGGDPKSRSVTVSMIYRSSPLAAVGLRPYDRILEINDEPATLASFRRHIQSAYSIKLKYQRPSGQIKECTAIRSEDIHESNSYYLPFLFDYQSTGSGNYLGIGLWQLIYHSRNATLIPFKDKKYGEKQDDYKRIQRKMKRFHKAERELFAVRFRASQSKDFDEFEEKILVAEIKVKERRKEVAELEQEAEDIYRSRFEWGMFANLLYYQSDVNPETGRKKRRFRLFWLFTIGPELTDDM